MIYTKTLHKKVINANSSEKIAPTDGINPFPANASGCADGNYRMYVNMGAPGSTATRTAEPGPVLPGPWARGKQDLERFGAVLPLPCNAAAEGSPEAGTVPQPWDVPQGHKGMDP